jgi:hypothetical protein
VARGIPYEYESESFKYIVERTYTPDFLFPACKLVVECKGRFTASDRSKMLKVKPIMEARGWRVALLFMNSSVKLYKGSKTTYGQWATKHGFLWCEGVSVPKRWLRC